jgi:serine/threonine protein kinase/tetratricopeptide (TPR) repeat protein
MGVVYRARHVTSERAVALKTVRVATPRWIESIRREIDALTRIRHPGVVRILEHGVHEGLPWYAMDLLEGESLRRFGQRLWSRFSPVMPAVAGTGDRVSQTEDLAPEGGLPGSTPPATGASSSEPPRSGEQLRVGHGGTAVAGQAPVAGGELRTVLQLVREVCSSLAFMHGEGFVNCDLKPENILIVDGRPVLIDFGLTVQHPGGSGRESIEATHSMSGTLPYMSPEQIRGELVDARADLYAVGCLLYELLTGSPPFAGAPQSLRTQHLSSSPAALSSVVSGVPSELERIVLKLLAKTAGNRFGFADEVATALGRLIGEAGIPTDFPPSRPYLYRPRLVGRTDLLARLGTLRERAIAGSGAFVLLGGESGVGKTRLAMEVTRLDAGGGRTLVITSEAAALSAQHAAADAAPLQAVRPLLRAIADRCLEGGAAMTERLLGGRRSVLAAYEPLLEQVPAAESLVTPFPLGVDAARQRLFSYLTETLAAFAREQPILWVLDDLGWADELSLGFLQTLTAEFLEWTPVLILGTYRSEEAPPAIASLAGRPQVTHVALPRLDKQAVASMIDDMLALPQTGSPFVDFVATQGEGNPFFVTEHVRAAVAERVLYRDGHNDWRLRAPSDSEVPDPAGYASIPLPGSLRELLERRLRSLTPAAREVGIAAAVIGREAELETLRSVTQMLEETLLRAVDELVRRQVVEQLELGRIRFAHDKLREVAYSDAVPARVVVLHVRAAFALEERLASEIDPGRSWATLGHHFAAGGLAEQAANYYQRAADHARSRYANGDAIRLYREALAQVEAASSTSRPAGSDVAQRSSTSPPPLLADLQEALGDVLALTGSRSESRAAYDTALAGQSANPAGRARIYRKLGKTWETEHRHDDALQSYGLAREAVRLGGEPGSAELDEWIQVRIEQLWVCYWLARISEMNTIVTELQSTVEKYGSPTQRSRFLQGRVQLNLRRDRYVVNEETLGFSRSALEALSGDSSLTDLPMARFGYGFALLFHQSLVGAREQLLAAFELAERAGDAAQQARCLTYLTLAFRMGQCVEETREYAERSSRLAAVANMGDYLGAARANQAWVALRDGATDIAVRLARDATATWARLSPTYSYPFQWIALLPKMEVDLARGRTEEALRAAEALLGATQQPLPGFALDAFRLASTVFISGESRRANQILESAIHGLRGTVYE